MTRQGRHCAPGAGDALAAETALEATEHHLDVWAPLWGQLKHARLAFSPESSGVQLAVLLSTCLCCATALTHLGLSTATCATSLAGQDGLGRAALWSHRKARHRAVCLSYSPVTSEGVFLVLPALSSLTLEGQQALDDARWTPAILLNGIRDFVPAIVGNVFEIEPGNHVHVDVKLAPSLVDLSLTHLATADRVCGDLAAAGALTALHLHECSVSCPNAVSNLLGTQPKLQALSLVGLTQGRPTVATHASRVALATATLPMLTYLNLSHSPHVSASPQALVQFLQRSPGLQEVNLTATSTKPTSLPAVFPDVSGDLQPQVQGSGAPSNPAAMLAFARLRRVSVCDAPSMLLVLGAVASGRALQLQMLDARNCTAMPASVLALLSRQTGLRMLQLGGCLESISPPQVRLPPRDLTFARFMSSPTDQTCTSLVSETLTRSSVVLTAENYTCTEFCRARLLQPCS